MILGAAIVLKHVLDVVVGMQGADISTPTTLLVGFLFLFYMNKIREAIVRQQNIMDSTLLCMNPCCENYWCQPCMACFFMRHELNVKERGRHYESCCSPTGTGAGAAATVQTV